MIDTVMESDGGLNFRHRRSPSSDRFLGVFSPPKTDSTTGGGNSVAGDELNEDDVFWTGDFAQPNLKPKPPPPAGSSRREDRHRFEFRMRENFGILAALPDDEQNRGVRDRPVLCRKPLISSSSSSSSSSTSSSRMIPAIPKKPLQSSAREMEFSQSMPVARKFHQSAPMNVPAMPKAMSKASAKNRELVVVDDDDDEGGEEEMLPPHEIVARGSARERDTTFSVLEGVGRTLKGRDLRQVRNAVWRQTGFLD